MCPPQHLGAIIKHSSQTPLSNIFFFLFLVLFCWGGGTHQMRSCACAPTIVCFPYADHVLLSGRVSKSPLFPKDRLFKCLSLVVVHEDNHCNVHCELFC